MIEFVEVSKKYDENNVINGISLKINKGEIFGIIGESGAGKSSLIRMINQLIVPSEGKVLIEGVDVNKLDKKSLLLQKQKIGMIFQHFNLLSSATVLDNVMLPLKICKVKKQEAKARALKILEIVGLLDKKDFYPAQLSGGQKQRVGIARAIITNPDILLCDEPTSALDSNNTKEILKLLKDINKQMNITIVIISHDIKVIQNVCHRVATIDKGNIKEIKEINHNENLNIIKVEADCLDIKHLTSLIGDGIELVKVKINKNTLENDYCLLEILNENGNLYEELKKLGYSWEVL